MYGHIFLDIDGTITDEDHHIQDEVALYLKNLSEKGWQISLVTGRMFSFAMRTLDKLDFPFYLSLSNGADIMSMPEKKVISRSYLLKDVAKTFHTYRFPYTIDAGFDRGDFSYYPPAYFSQEGMKYIELRRKLAPLEWVAFDDIEEIEQEAFPSIKTFGKREDLEYLESKILLKHPVHTSILTDPIDDRLCVFIINAIDASKGDTVRRIKELVPKEGPAICAGNDMNDVTLLQAGDIRIAVGNGPEELTKLADFVAPPSTECGIIEALERYAHG